MQIEFSNSPKQLALAKLIAGKDPAKAKQALEMFAALVAPRLGQILQQADTTRLIYRDFPFTPDEVPPTMPVEPLLNIKEKHLSVWSQSMPGGLPTNHVYQPTEEVPFVTYRLDSAISWHRKFANKSRLNVIAMYLERLAQEILLKTNRQAWSVLLRALANASNDGIANVVRVDTAGRLSFDDLNRLFTRIRRQNQSWASGSPTEQVGKLTDMIISPEVKEQLREFAYNPINTKGANGNAPGAGDIVNLPEAERARMLAGGGIQTLFDVNLIEMNELGIGQKYNTLFDAFAGSKNYAQYDGSGSTTFDGDAEELAIGLDLGQTFAYRAIETDPDSQSTFTLINDDQFLARQEKVGLYGYMNEGRLITKTRPIHGLII